MVGSPAVVNFEKAIESAVKGEPSIFARWHPCVESPGCGLDRRGARPLCSCQGPSRPHEMISFPDCRDSCLTLFKGIAACSAGGTIGLQRLDLIWTLYAPD